MFFSKKDILSLELLQGVTDHHSHILCGVDDGIQKLKESLDTLTEYERLGIKKVICTPHIMEDYEDNNASFLRARFEEFKAQYTGNIELSLAAEYMLDSQFDSHLESGDMLTLWDNYILIETSYSYAPSNFMASLKYILSKGYFIVLAHPERYLYMSKDDWKTLKEMGVLFQLNLLSFSGVYGSQAKKNALDLLSDGFYNMMGTDIHSLRAFKKYMSLIKFTSKQQKQLKSLLSNTK